MYVFVDKYIHERSLKHATHIKNIFNFHILIKIDIFEFSVLVFLNLKKVYLFLLRYDTSS